MLAFFLFLLFRCCVRNLAVSMSVIQQTVRPRTVAHYEFTVASPAIQIKSLRSPSGVFQAVVIALVRSMVWSPLSCRQTKFGAQTMFLKLLILYHFLSLSSATLCMQDNQLRSCYAGQADASVGQIVSSPHWVNLFFQ